jgi:hypothetical protein
MIQRLLTAGLLAALPLSLPANGLSSAEIEGRSVATGLLEQSPAENSSLTGALEIRGAKKARSRVPVRCRIILTETHWQTIYETLPGTNAVIEKLIVTHNGAKPSRYEFNCVVRPNSQTAVPFAGSDFWLSDLGLEFLHWPGQKLLKKELKKSQSCNVLESTNPAPLKGDYSRVVSWIDIDTGGIVYAEAYDAKGRRMKEFEVKELKKVRGQWQLQEMQIRDTQSGSRTSLEFDLERR